MEKVLIKLEGVSKYYKTETGVSEGIRNVSVEFKLNEFVAITGESGSGKTTLLNVISGLDTYEDGELYIDGNETSHFGVRDFEELRRKSIGFVFQNYNVIESYTVYQNVVLALETQGYDKNKKKQRALELIKQVGLLSHKNQKTSKLSGGQKQRVVIARALAKDSPIILADEPTGNLDSNSGIEIMELLKKVSKNKLIIIVSHNYEEVENYITRNVEMGDGGIKSDKIIRKEINENFENGIVENKNIHENSHFFKKTALISLRNLFSMPKRTIFSISLMIVTVFLFLFLYGSMIKNTLDNMTGNVFSNMDIKIQLRQKEIFDKDDINTFKNTYGNRDLAIAPLIFQDIRAEEYQFRTSDYLIASNVNGRMPQKKDEIVVGTDTWTMNNSKIGNTVTIINKQFTIVGNTKDDHIYVFPELFHDENYAPTDFFKEIVGPNQVEKYQLSSLIILGKDKRAVNIMLEKVKKNSAYRILDSSQGYREIVDTFSIINFIITSVFFVLFISLISLITFHIQKGVMVNRKKDFSVYRSIGITEVQVGLVLLIEQIIVALVSSFILFGAIEALKETVEFFNDLARNFHIIDYAIVSAVFLFLTVRQAFSINRKIFGVSVITSLKEEN